ncbi:SGNH/GDSL hydrolase family protein [Sphingomonas sp. CJ99]
MHGRRLAALALSALAWPAAAGFGPDVDRTPLPVHIGGRTIDEGKAGQRFGWPGVYVEARFTGDTVRLQFDAPTDFIRLSVDGRERQVFRAPGKVDTIVDGLGKGEHVIRLDKLTETQSGESRFVGMELIGPGRAYLAPERAMQIEVIGDSHSVGYGNVSDSRDCTTQQVHDLTDTTQAYGAMVARGLDADYRIHAYSGFGVVRNYAGGEPGDSMVKRYPRAIPGEASPLAGADSEWQPDVIVVNLGTNDFSTPVKPGEKWADAEALKADYRATYAAFLRDLARAQPQARFVLLGGDSFYDQVEQVAATLAGALPGRVVTRHVTGLEMTGCHYHPSVADNAKMAELVRGALGE